MQQKGQGDDWGNHGTNGDDDATDVDQSDYGGNLHISEAVKAY